MFKKQFTDVQRTQCKAAIMIEGLSGSGKSGLALLIAKHLASDQSKVFAIDTEARALNLFADLPASDEGVFKGFKKVDLTPEDGYAPSNYLALRKLAIENGAEVVIFDSITHAWQHQGGVLTMVNDFVASKNNNDKYAAWRNPKIANEKNLLLDLLRCNDCHMITTVRLKEKFALEDNPTTGKKEVKSLGDQQIMQDDIKYEPDLVLHMETPGNATVQPPLNPVVTVVKSRYAIFNVGDTLEIDAKVLSNLKAYLEEGVDPKELLETQRKDYINELKLYLKNNPTKTPIWQILKQNAGYENKKIEELSLSTLKTLYNQLTE